MPNQDDNYIFLVDEKVHEAQLEFNSALSDYVDEKAREIAKYECDSRRDSPYAGILVFRAEKLLVNLGDALTELINRCIARDRWYQNMEDSP